MATKRTPTTKKPRKRLPWRVQADATYGGQRSVRLDSAGSFDEFVLGKPGTGSLSTIIHIERMSAASYFVDVAGIVVWVTADREGHLRARRVELRDVHFVNDTDVTDFYVGRDKDLEPADGQ